jgi:hypothetical protein
VDKGVVLRVKSICNRDTVEHEPKVIFIGDDFTEYRTIPILSLTVDQSDFWSYEKGIYVSGQNYSYDHPEDQEYSGNQFQRGKEWERNAFMHYFNDNGDLSFAQGVGVRIHGGTSRKYVNRSFRLYARKEYGTKHFDFPFFDNNTKHKRIKLRTSGQDIKHAYFRDGLVALLMERSALTVESYKPVNLFINAEYWGITNMRERFDEKFLKNKYGISEDDSEIIKGWQNDNQSFSDFRDFLKKGNPNDKEFFKTVDESIDLMSFIDLKIAEIYFGQWDVGHWKLWRNKSDPSSKWKWLVWDFDVGLGLPNKWAAEWTYNTHADNNYLERFLTDYRVDQENFEFVTLMKNDSIKSMFINRFMQMIHSNLSTEYIHETIDSLQTILTPVMPKHIERWNQVQGIQSMEKWHESIKIIKDFTAERGNHITNHLQDFFDLNEPTQIIIENPSCGELYVNDQPLTELLYFKSNGGFWTGSFFNEIPIKISIKNCDDFKGWLINGNLEVEDDTIIIRPNQNNLTVSTLSLVRILEYFRNYNSFAIVAH